MHTVNLEYYIQIRMYYSYLQLFRINMALTINVTHITT